MPSLADLKRASVAEILGVTPTSRALGQLEWDYFSVESGLTPANKYTLADHKYAFYKSYLGYTTTSKSLRDLEREYYKAQGAAGSTHADLEYDLYTNLGGFYLNPLSLSGLAAWYDAEWVGTKQATLAYDDFTRTKNLLTNPSFESGTTGWIFSANTTAGTTTAWSASGATAATLTAVAAGDVQILAPYIAITPGTTYTVSATVRNTDTVARNVRWAANTRNSSGGYRTSYTSVDVSIPAGGSQRVVWTRTLHANDYQFQPILTGYGFALGAVLQVDAVQLEEGSKATLFTWGDANNLGSSPSGHAWTAALGAFGITNGKARPTATTEQVSIIDVGTPDVDVSVDITPVNNDGIVLRGDSTFNNGILIQFPVSSMLVRFWKKVGGVWTNVADGGNFAAGTQTARVVLKGTLLIVYVGGVSVLNHTITDADILAMTGTRVGIRSTSNTTATYDNFTVKTPVRADGDAVGVFPDLSGNYRHAFQTDAAKQPRFRTTNRNLLTYNQASVETDLTGLNAIVNCTVARNTSGTANHGVAFLTATSTANADLQFGIPTAAAIPVTPGKVYGGTVAVKSSTTKSAHARLVFWNDAGALLTYPDGTASALTTSYTTRTVIGVAPAGATKVTLRVYVTGAALNETFDADSLGIFDLTPTWTLGGTGGNILTADASSLETSLGGWTAQVNITAERAVVSDAYHGTAVLRLTKTVSGATSFAALQSLSGLTIGQTYIVIARGRVVSGVGTGVLVGLAGASNTNTTIDTSWTEAQHMFTATATSHSIYVSTSSGAAGEVIEWDAIGVYALSVPAWVPPVTIPNNKPVLQFDGKDDNLQGPQTALGPFTVYSVARQDVLGVSAGIVSGDDNIGTTARHFQHKFISGGFQNIAFDSGGNPISAGLANTNSNWGVQASVRSDTQLSARINGGTPNTATVSNIIRSPRLGIGASRSGSPSNEFLAGDIAAILIFEGAHDDTTRKRVERYLGRRYGVTIAA